MADTGDGDSITTRDGGPAYNNNNNNDINNSTSTSSATKRNHRRYQINGSIIPLRERTHAYKGVSYDKCSDRYKAYFYHDRKRRSLGSHFTAEDAARAYDVEARVFEGKTALVNFPIPGSEEVCMCIVEFVVVIVCCACYLVAL